MTMLARLLAMLLLLTGLGLVGAGPASAAAKPSAPRAVAAAPGNGSATVTWKAPARKGGSKIRKYGVQRRSGSSWTTVATVSGSTLSWQATGLGNGQSYEFRVRARNKGRWGKPSARVTVRPRTVPGIPAQAEADGYGSALGFYWRAPASNGAPIDFYRVEVSTDGATWSSPVDTPTVGTSVAPLMVTGLTPGARYRLRVRAHNAAGFGEDGQAGPYRVYAGSGPVLTPTATSADGTVSLAWAKPVASANDGLQEAGQYLVEHSADDGTTWTEAGRPTGTAFSATGLTNGVTYQFRISARPSTRYPFGPATVVLADPPTGPPGVPQGLALGWDTEASDHLLSWSAPTNDGGFAIHHYEVESAPPGSTSEVPGGTTSIVAGPNALDHTYRVRACGAEKGCGPWAGPVGPAGAPPYELSVSTDTVALDEGTTATFDVGLGFPALTDTVVSLESSDTAVEVDGTVTVPAGSSSAEVTVTAAEDDDADDGSAIVTATLGAQQRTVAVSVDDTTPPPGPVTFEEPVLTRTSPTSYTVALAWTAPATGPVSDYLVQRSVDGGEFADLGTTATPSYDDTSAAPLTSYTYRVIPSGPAGDGTPADQPVTTGPAYGLSASPTAVTVVEGGSDQFAVSIEAPEDTDVAVTVTASDPGVVTVPVTVTIQPGQTSALVMVEGVQDVDVADEGATVTVALGAEQRQVAVTVIDDDAQALVVDPAGPIDLATAGSSAEVHVRLAHQPSGPVTVDLAYSGNKAHLSVPQLTFTTANWAVDQTFTITKTGNNETATLTITTVGALPVQVQVST